MNELAVFGNMCRLASLSPRHRSYTVDEAVRYFWPPVMLRQFIMADDGSAFLTWAWLREDVAQSFRAGVRKLCPEDWNSGSELWTIDIIAPHGTLRPFLREIRKMIPKGMRGKFLRTKRTGSLARGWVNA